MSRKMLLILGTLLTVISTLVSSIVIERLNTAKTTIITKQAEIKSERLVSMLRYEETLSLKTFADGYGLVLRFLGKELSIEDRQHIINRLKGLNFKTIDAISNAAHSKHGKKDLETAVKCGALMKPELRQEVNALFESLTIDYKNQIDRWGKQERQYQKEISRYESIIEPVRISGIGVQILGLIIVLSANVIEPSTRRGDTRNRR